MITTKPKVASSVNLPWIVNVLIQFAHDGQGAQEDEGQAQDDVVRLHPEEAPSDKAVSAKAARLSAHVVLRGYPAVRRCFCRRLHHPPTHVPRSRHQYAHDVYQKSTYATVWRTRLLQSSLNLRSSPEPLPSVVTTLSVWFAVPLRDAATSASLTVGRHARACSGAPSSSYMLIEWPASDAGTCARQLAVVAARDLHARVGVRRRPLTDIAIGPGALLPPTSTG